MDSLSRNGYWSFREWMVFSRDGSWFFEEWMVFHWTVGLSLDGLRLDGLSLEGSGFFQRIRTRVSQAIGWFFLTS